MIYDCSSSLICSKIGQSGEMVRCKVEIRVAALLYFPSVFQCSMLLIRKKVIGLDDLLTDYYKEKGKCIEGESKRKKARKNDSSDEEDNTREATLSRALEKYQKQVNHT